ncbi:MAG: DUF4097 family beta strand repeat-containing protein [Gordonibacter pamelaeae]
MTTARKAVLIVATVLLVGGSALALGAFAAADFRFENLSNDTRDWASTTLTLDAESETPHTVIVVSDRDEGVRFEPADGDAIEVVYWTSSEKAVDVVDEGGTLAITGRGTSLAGFQFMKVGFQDHATVVKVPRSYTGSLTVETSSGSIDVADLDGLGSVVALGEQRLRVGHARKRRQRRSEDLERQHRRGWRGGRGLLGTGIERLALLRRRGGILVRGEDFERGPEPGRRAREHVERPQLERRHRDGGHRRGGRRAGSVERVDPCPVRRHGGRLRHHGLLVERARGRAPNGTTGAAKRIVASTTSGSIDLELHARQRDARRLRGRRPRRPGSRSAPQAPAAPEAPAAPKAPAAS